jgi:hypothetical protein
VTSEQLSQLQGFGSLVLLLCLGLGAIHLLLGLVRPGWVWRRGRGGVVALSLGLWLLGVAVWGGIIGFTHSHPNGPHSVTGYIDDYFAEQCAQGADLQACRKDGAVPAAAAPPAAAQP